MSGTITQQANAFRVAATALLIAGLWASPAFADDKNASPGSQPAPGSTPGPATGQKQEVPKEGTREATEAAAQEAQDAYNKYQQTCSDGTDEQKEAAKEDWLKKMAKVNWAIADEANKTKEVREARDNMNHYDKAREQLENNPNSSASDLGKATSDSVKAISEFQIALTKAEAKIRGEIKSKFTYGGPKSCPPPEEKKKKKKDKGETSGPLDFFGNVTIGIGVGGAGSQHHGDHHDRDKRTDKQSQPSAQNCCTHQGQSVQCPSGLPAGSSSVKFVNGGTTWATPTGGQEFVPQTSFPSCK